MWDELRIEWFSFVVSLREILRHVERSNEEKVYLLRKTEVKLSPVLFLISTMVEWWSVLSLITSYMTSILSSGKSAAAEVINQ